MIEFIEDDCKTFFRLNKNTLAALSDKSVFIYGFLNKPVYIFIKTVFVPYAMPWALTVPSIFLIKPCKTAPGPHSVKSVAPSAIIFLTD